MKRYLIKLATGIILMAIVGALVFTGCTEEEEPPPPPPPPVEEEEEPPPPPPVEEVWEWPEKLFLVSGPGMGVEALTGWTALMSADTGMQIRIVEIDNTLLRFKWIAQGRFFHNIDGNATTVEYLEASLGNNLRDTGPFQVRVLWAASQSNLGYMTRGDSDIKTVHDIKPGTKIVEWTFGAAMETTYSALLAWAQVDWDDIIWVPASNFPIIPRLITGGQADLTFFFPTAGFTYEAEATPEGISWIELPADEDPEGAKRYLEKQPTHSFGTISLGVPSAIGVRGLDMLSPFLSPADSDPDLVYHYIKWMDENYDRYKDTHANNLSMTLDNTMRIMETSFIPAHEGLVRYLTELGKWTPAHEARNQQNIALLNRYVEAYQEAMDMADEQGILVDPENEEWTELWENYKQELGLPHFKLFVGLED